MITTPQNENEPGMSSRLRPRHRHKDFKIGYWNTLTLFRPGALKVLLNEIIKYDLDLVAIQEVRWNGHGILESKNYNVYYSCHPTLHTFGTGFIVRGRAQQLVIDFKPISPRICWLRIKGRFYNFSYLSIHAPTEVSEEEEKDAFYDLLDKAVDDCPRADIKIIMGDFNAKIGKERIYCPTIGAHSLHEESNGNGMRLINFAASKGLVVGSTLFPHRDIHKATWTSPSGNISNQIDHLLISARHRSNLLDVRSYRGANVDSDHYLSIARVRARISNVRNVRGSVQKKINISKLKKDEICSQYMHTLDSELCRLQSGENSEIDSKWGTCKETIARTAETILGTAEKTCRSPWFDEECMEVTKRKNEAYQSMLSRKRTRASTELYRGKRREEKKVHRRKKRQWENRELEDIEGHRSQNECRDFYRKINCGRKPFKPRLTTCRDEDGQLLSNPLDILNRWKRHFDDLLKGCAPEETPRIDEVTQADEIEPPDEEEICEALSRLKNNKAPGADSLPAELFKCGGQELVKFLQEILLAIWTNERLPKEWCTTIICPIHKKGDQLECSNYRGISLLPAAYKILSNILFQRLLPYVESILGRYQCGFRKGKSTIDQIFNLRMILEKGREYQLNTYHLFIDFKAAYDSVNRCELYKAMSEMNIPIKLVRLVAMTMSNVHCAVRIQSNISPQFQARNGLRQGDALACLLFNLALERVIRESGLQTSGTIFHKSIQLLAYADDIDIIGRSVNDVKAAFLSIEANGRRLGLMVNEEKTKFLSTDLTLRGPLCIGNYRFENVAEFVYLGTLITADNNVSREVRRRLISANKCYYGLNRHFKSKLLTRATKFRLYKTLIRPVLAYASETWTISKADEHSLQVFERKLLRKIYGPVREGTIWRRRRNRELYALIKEPPLVAWIRLNRLRWAGHVARLSDNEIPSKLLREMPDRKRRAGRPKLRWYDGINHDARSILGLRNWIAAAKDRDDWRKHLEEARTHNTGL